MKLRHSVLLALLTFVLMPACKSVLTGNEGNLEFTYPADDRVADFNKPIAVGAKLELEVRDAGSRKAVSLTSASTEDDSVLRVVSFSGSKLILEGVSSGGTLVLVEANTTGGALGDSVNMLARVPEVMKLANTCVTEASAQYLTGQDIIIPYDFEMSNGQPVIGFGYFPITLEPATGMTLDTTSVDQQWFHFTTGATAQNVTLSNSIDSTTLTLELVEVGSVDGGMLQLDSLLPAEVGKKRALYVLPTANGRPICQAQTDYSVVTDSPEVCTVTAIVAPDTADLGVAKEFGWLEVEGLTAGTCNFTVTYTEGAAGVGASSALAVPVNP
ncbi:MAG: hypothetical protein CO108_00760 [Deltaproteobacteria bacterium CG_4_9_14_3_um_filter_63_12]|nr:MAG: hypothetical protein CO108_00760 [Deltaproteobacteria bacterium CG_4_9_14_3_um_filter_63_12]